VKKKTIFLDRDGTIIVDKGYLADPAGVVLLPNAVKGMKLLLDNNFRIIVTTNQSGIARKYLTLKTLAAIHRNMKQQLARHGIKVAEIYYCPHGPHDSCKCRKPEPGMALKAKRKYGINLAETYGAGDKVRDVEFIKNFGGKGILVLTGLGKKERKLLKGLPRKSQPDFIAKDLYDMARWILQQQATDAHG